MKKRALCLTSILVVLALAACLMIGNVLAADTACDGYTLGTSNGSPACVQGEALHICENNFPDAAFRGYISESLDRDSDGLLTAEEINGITTIDCSELGVQSLEGIAFFKNLFILECSKNAITSLDVSHNPRLIKLDCSSNELTALDLTHNTALSSLDCDYNGLTALNLSSNTALESLNCQYNELTALNLSSNTALTALYCGFNAISSLDLSNNTTLWIVQCPDNAMASLELPDSTALTELYCYDNALTSLDVSKNTALTILRCGGSNLTSLDISKNTALTELDCGNNNLTALNLSSNTALTALHCSFNALSSLDLSQNTVLESLICSSNALTSLDLSKNTALTELDCHNNALTSLDISKNTALTMLYCEFNALPSLDLSNQTALYWLGCGAQSITHTFAVEYTDGSYVFDMAELLSEDALAALTSVTGGTYDAETHKALFTYLPETFTYKLTYTYAEGTQTANMDVTVTVETVPVETEPVETEPVETEPIETEPIETEPVETEPVVTEPIETEPVETEPVVTEPVETNPVETVPQPGKVENTTDSTANSHGAQLSNTIKELADKLLSDAELEKVNQGEDVYITLTVNDISTTVSAEDIAAIAEELGGYTAGIYLDVTLEKQIGSSEPEQITKTNGAVTVTITVPETLRGAGYTYKIIRLHNGIATVLDAVYNEADGTLSFQTDMFSTYALVYQAAQQDTADPTEPVETEPTETEPVVTEPVETKPATTTPDVPKTGDGSALMIWVLLCMIALCGMVTVALPLQHRKKS